MRNMKFYLTCLILMAITTSPFSMAMENDNERQGMKRAKPDESFSESNREPKRLKVNDTIEVDSDKMDLEKKDDCEEEYCLKGLIDDVKNVIISLFDPSKDQKTLLNFSRADKSFHALVEAAYTIENETKKHQPWFDLDILPSTLYFLNTRMLRILGLYNNIKCYDNMADNVDRIRFERLCSQFLIKTDLFSETSIPVTYVTMLQLDLMCSNPTLFQDPFAHLFQKEQEDAKKSSIRELSTLATLSNSVWQNEGALYFHYCQFVFQMDPSQLMPLKNTPFFRQLDSSLMRVMNPKLISLKETWDLWDDSDHSDDREIWKEIIDLEPMATCLQLDTAAYAYFQVGCNTTDAKSGFDNFTKAAKYREGQLQAIFAANQKPTAKDYWYIGLAYFSAGQNATDAKGRFENFTKAAKYYEDLLQAIFAKDEKPTPNDYRDIANAYLNAGKNAADAQEKFENFTKAAKYYEDQLQAIFAEGQKPMVYDYGDIANAYSNAGQNATDAKGRLENLTKAKGHYEAFSTIGLSPEIVEKIKSRVQEIDTYLSEYNKTPSEIVDE